MKKIYSLDKGWKFIKESELISNNLEDYFDMFSNNTKTGAAGGARGEDCYDASWETVDLPHDWHVGEIPEEGGIIAQGHRKGGRVWYRKHFSLTGEEYKKRVFLKFDAIAIESEIYVNSVKAAESESGSTPVFVEITDFIEENRQICIAVMTDNTQKEGWWYEGGGIFGHTYLIVTEESRIKNDGVFVYSEKKGNLWELNISAESELNDDLEVLFELPELKLREKKKAQKLTKCHFKNINPELWDVDSPKLYEVSVKLLKGTEIIDEVTVKTGFRECIFDSEKGFFINGKSIKLKGVCLHNDHAGVGVAMPEGIMEYRLKKLKSMGCNAIRTSHNPYLPEFYNLCDKLGIMIMNEIRHFSSTEIVLNQLKTFVKRDRNHPSVIMWSIFNEEPLQCSKRGKKIAEKMKKAITELDGTRPVSGGMNGPLESEGVVNVVDIMGFNYLQYGYDAFHEIHPEIPVIGSETGSYMTTRGCVETKMEKGKRCCYGRVMNENLYAWSDTPGGTWKKIEERDFVMGGFYWTGFDYRGECGKFPSNISYFGAMDICGFPKDNYFWHKVLWNDTPDLYISPHWNFSGNTAEIICYSNCEAIKLYINDKPVKEILNDKFNPELIELPYEKGTLKAEGYINNNKVTEKELSTFCEVKKLDSEEFVKDDVIVIDYYAKDENGTFVPTADKLIRFEVDGGKIIGVGNGDNVSLEKDVDNKRKLFNGCCQLIIRPEDENITVKAYGDGISENVTNITGMKLMEKDEIFPEKCKIHVSSWRMSDALNEYPQEYNIANLMFAWIPTTVGYGANYIFSNNSGYGIIAGTFSAPDIDEKIVLVFEEILGEVDIYFDKKLIISKKKGLHKNIELEIPENLKGKSVIVTVVFKTDATESGIPGNVYLK